ncbi:PLP-dependent cysteine synthase family protein [Chryseobacterium gallinarum]|uniref:Pyridoxal-phosphate dependent enzyme n=1 Tax=Chryseobacterium gallinarum TaxID=1324352 RepID=A0ABX6KQ33_CHRGL|nr:pyridoxal-phosphate dependent enzyme [Chryseobacterium gallinarum]QIY90733.1 pyridoxal-phosphate dependent enzyme [Chryseobacterium gallinarum]
MIFNSIMQMIGNTPLLKIDLGYKNVNAFVKMESFNPTGSIKDRACYYNILGAIQDGTLTKEKTILDASSGNMACSLAFFGLMMGYKVKVICNSKLTKDKEDFIRYFGADLEVLGDITFEGNQECRRIANTEEGKQKYCFLDQLHNVNNPKASYETLGPEIYRDLPNVKAVIGSMGSGGSMLGVSRFMKEQSGNIKIFTSQAASGTKIPGTGGFIDGDYKTPFIHELEDKKLYDDTFPITLEQAEKNTEILLSQGVFSGYQAGGVMEAAVQAIEKYNIEGDIVLVIGDAGWKNMEKLKRQW